MGKSTYSKQLSKIWVLAKNLDLSDDHLYLIVASVTGLDSLSKLVKSHPAKTDKLIKHLEHELYKQKRSQQRLSHLSGVIQFPTTAQRELVAKLVTEINQAGRMLTAENIAQRTYKKTCSKLNYYQLQGLIEALKSIRSRLHLPYKETEANKHER